MQLSDAQACRDRSEFTKTSQIYLFSILEHN